MMLHTSFVFEIVVDSNHFSASQTHSQSWLCCFCTPLGPQCFFFNLLHIDNTLKCTCPQSTCSRTFFARSTTQVSNKQAYSATHILKHLQSIAIQQGKLQLMLMNIQIVLFQSKKLSYLCLFQFSRKEPPQESPTWMWCILICSFLPLVEPSPGHILHLICNQINPFHINHMHNLKHLLQLFHKVFRILGST